MRGGTKLDLAELEHAPAQRHPWEESRARFFRRVLGKARLLARDVSVLDVGAGDAWFSEQLAMLPSPPVRIVCWDSAYGQAGATVAPVPGRMDFVREQPKEAFPLVLLLDVLEHVEDDAGFLDSVVRTNVERSGHVLVSVPAWPALLTSHDVKLRHRRRYTPATARRLVAGAGLEIEREGGLFHSLLLPRALQKLRERATGRSHAPADLGHWDAPPAVSKLVLAALLLDNWLSGVAASVSLRLPGLSWWALCRRPSR